MYTLNYKEKSYNLNDISEYILCIALIEAELVEAEAQESNILTSKKQTLGELLDPTKDTSRKLLLLFHPDKRNSLRADSTFFEIVLRTATYPLVSEAVLKSGKDLLDFIAENMFVAINNLCDMPDKSEGLRSFLASFCNAQDKHMTDAKAATDPKLKQKCFLKSFWFIFQQFSLQDVQFQGLNFTLPDSGITVLFTNLLSTTILSDKLDKCLEKYFGVNFVELDDKDPIKRPSPPNNLQYALFIAVYGMACRIIERKMEGSPEFEKAQNTSNASEAELFGLRKVAAIAILQEIIEVLHNPAFISMLQKIIEADTKRTQDFFAELQRKSAAAANQAITYTPLQAFKRNRLF